MNDKNRKCPDAVADLLVYFLGEGIKFDAYYAMLLEKFKSVTSVYDRSLKQSVETVRYLNDEQLLEVLNFAKIKNLDPFSKDFLAYLQKNGTMSIYLRFDGWFNILKRFVPEKCSFNIVEPEQGMTPFTFKKKVKADTYYSGQSAYNEVEETIQAPAWLQCEVTFKNGGTASIKEYFSENFMPTEAWIKSPFKMLRNKVITQTVRILLDGSGLLDEDDILKIAKMEENEELDLAMQSQVRDYSDVVMGLKGIGIKFFEKDNTIIVPSSYTGTHKTVLRGLGFIQESDGSWVISVLRETQAEEVAQQPILPEEPIVASQNIENVDPDIPPAIPTPAPEAPEANAELEIPMPVVNEVENILIDNGIDFKIKRTANGVCYGVEYVDADKIAVLTNLGFTQKQFKESGVFGFVKMVPNPAS